MSKTIEISRGQLERWYRQMRDLGLQKLPEEIMELLAAPAVERQPVAVMGLSSEGGPCVWFSRPPDGTMLYTSPPASVAMLLPEFNEWYVRSNVKLTRNQIELCSTV